MPTRRRAVAHDLAPSEHRELFGRQPGRAPMGAPGYGAERAALAASSGWALSG